MTLNEKIELAKSTKDETILEDLSKSEEKEILLNVAQNINTPLNTLEKLKKYEDNEIVEKAIETFNLSIQKKLDNFHKEDIKVEEVLTDLQQINKKDLNPKKGDKSASKENQTGKSRQ